MPAIDNNPPSNDAPSVSAAADVPKGCRALWQCVVAVLLGIYGGIAALSGAWFTIAASPGGVAMFVRGSVEHPDYIFVMSNAQRCVAALAFALFSLHGILAMVAGRYLWKGQGRRCLGSIALAIIFVIMMIAISSLPHLLPPGKQLLPPLRGGVSEIDTSDSR